MADGDSPIEAGRRRYACNCLAESSTNPDARSAEKRLRMRDTENYSHYLAHLARGDGNQSRRPVDDGEQNERSEPPPPEAETLRAALRIIDLMNERFGNPERSNARLQQDLRDTFTVNELTRILGFGTAPPADALQDIRDLLDGRAVVPEPEQNSRALIREGYREDAVIGDLDARAVGVMWSSVLSAAGSLSEASVDPAAVLSSLPLVFHSAVSFTLSASECARSKSGSNSRLCAGPEPEAKPALLSCT